MRLSARVIGFTAAMLLHPWATAAQALPQHWVSAGGALTEWVVAMGGESKLVGVDTTSQHPDSVKSLKSIGYQRALSSEGILSLNPRPDILIGTEEMGPPPVLEQIRAAGLHVEMFDSKPDLPTLQANLLHLGRLLGDEGHAGQLFDDYRQQLTTHQAWVKQAEAAQPAPGVILLLGHMGAKPLVAGPDTVADWMITQAGGRNLATQQGYKNFSTEVLAALDPQVIVFADRSLSGEAAIAALLKDNPALASTRAVKDKRIVQLDPTLLVGGLGPRLPASLNGLSQAFFPDAKPAQ
ncbi:putative hemin transporter substrate-binding protein [Pseudomonas sp. M47T1]|uniref:heme/hemin ABC transporter substrate-binding protein n=1 Tax=unclassified Pseudomonas TaxID=196821 RepID=UPI0002608438|nr:ABC transporter substrate-binding protein [Pseudomonas sp. M47T1]EIK93191.1 putative hemin transporter substrate-binding protein [Pseudomonas sp. M47T1]